MQAALSLVSTLAWLSSPAHSAFLTESTVHKGRTAARDNAESLGCKIFWNPLKEHTIVCCRCTQCRNTTRLLTNNTTGRVVPGVLHGLAGRGAGSISGEALPSIAIIVVSTSASSSTCSELLRRWPQENFLSFILSFSEIPLPPSSWINSSVSPMLPVVLLWPSPSPLSLLESQERNSSSEGLRSPSRLSSWSPISKSRVSATTGSFSSSWSWSIRQRRNSWVSWKQDSFCVSTHPSRIQASKKPKRRAASIHSLSSAHKSYQLLQHQETLLKQRVPQRFIYMSDQQLSLIPIDKRTNFYPDAFIWKTRWKLDSHCNVQTIEWLSLEGTLKIIQFQTPDCDLIYQGATTAKRQETWGTKGSSPQRTHSEQHNCVQDRWLLLMGIPLL